jgi:hypothetical protein
LGTTSLQKQTTIITNKWAIRHQYFALILTGIQTCCINMQGVYRSQLLYNIIRLLCFNCDKRVRTFRPNVCSITYCSSTCHLQKLLHSLSSIIKIFKFHIYGHVITTLLWSFKSLPKKQNTDKKCSHNLKFYYQKHKHRRMACRYIH